MNLWISSESISESVIAPGAFFLLAGGSFAITRYLNASQFFTNILFA